MRCPWIQHGRTIRLFAAAFLLSLSAVPISSSLGGEPTQQQIAKARETYREGVALEAANDWGGALAKFEAVAAVKMTPQVRFHIGRCKHRLGQLLEALGEYRMAVHDASQSKDPKAPEVMKEASEGVTEIEQKIPKLIITRGKGAETGSITLDGIALGQTSIGKEVPVNPGGHTIEFKGADGKANRTVITVTEGETRKVELVQEGEPPPPPPASSKSVEPPPPPPPPPPSGPGVLPWVALGVGGASLITSGVFYLLRSSAIKDLDSECVDNRCPPSKQDVGDKGKTYTTVGNVTLGLGIVGIGVGTVLLLTSGGSDSNSSTPAKNESRLRPRMTVVVGGSSNSGEARLVGTF